MAKPLVSDELWARIEPLIPQQTASTEKGGRPPVDDRAVLTGILFVLKTGIPWEDLDDHVSLAKNPDYTVRIEDVRAWEKRHGPIPEGAFVALRTDWSKRWPDAKAMAL
jgi:transposase